MRYWFRHGLIALACAVLVAGAARTDENNANAGDGPSRGELFELRLRAELGPQAALAAAAAPPFFLPADVKDGTIIGIDVSHHNDENCRCKPGQDCGDCKINWSRIQSQKVAFVYLKATQGTRYRDPTFDYHWRTLAQHNIARGAYHFMSADEDPIVQAENFLNKMEQDGKLRPVDLPPCLDLESDLRKDASKRWFITPDSGQIRDFWTGQDPDEIIQKVLKWLKHVEEKTGRTPIIYTSRGWWNDLIKDEKKFAQLARYPIWVANYPGSGSHVNAQPKVPNGHTWALWQFTETGRVNDTEVMPGKMDINIFNGALGDFNQALGVAFPEKKEVVAVVAPKEENKPSEPTIEAKPNEPMKPPESKDSGNPPQQVAGVNPSEPADSSKPSEPATAVKPPEPKDSGNPPQQAAGNNPSAPNDTTKPSEQVASINPAEPKDTRNPSEPVTAVKPPEPKDTGNPPQQVAGVNPSEPKDASKPSEQTAGVIPAEPKDAGSPPQQAAGINPSEPKDISKPAETVGSINPSEPKDSGTPANQQASVNPSDAKPSTGTGTQRARSRSSASRAATRNQAAQNQVAQNTQTTIVQSEPPATSMIEIVLVNGRTIRVDASIDPAILSRLVTALDAK